MTLSPTVSHGRGRKADPLPGPLPRERENGAANAEAPAVTTERGVRSASCAAQPRAAR